MSYGTTILEGTNSSSPLMEKLLHEKKIAREFQERRHDAWNEIYELYRNKVRTNRLTQRQTVNIPLMKETVKTLLSKIDDAPSIEWRELGGDKQKEIILQELWNTTQEKENFEGVDMQDKKSVLLYGRGFKKLNWCDNWIDLQALDIYDVVIDPLVDPLDIESARFIIQQNIFKPLREILADTRYSAKGKEELKKISLTDQGLVQSSKNREEWEKKMERLRALGVDSSEFSLFSGGDVLVQLCEHYTSIWNVKTKSFERRVVTYADDSVPLLNEPLVDLIGIEKYPFVSWGEDIETTDFWSDGPSDLVRIPNKLVNIWFSQLAENRTLRNFQMHWYDATVQGYQPQTYEPGPGRMLPAPGDPNKTIMPVGISGLDESLTAIDFITKVVERGTAATAIEKGVSERAQITLGEVKTLVGKATERTMSLAKFYRRSWQELAMKWYLMMDANMNKDVKLQKISSKGNVWPKTVYPSDWKSKAGFKAYARSSSEQEEEKTKAVQRFQFLLQQFPENSALKRVAQRRMLDVADLSVEEINEIVEEEKQKITQIEKQQELVAQAAGQVPQAVPMQEQQQQGAPNEVQSRLEKIGSLNQEDALYSKIQQFISAAGVEDNPLKERLFALTRNLQ